MNIGWTEEHDTALRVMLAEGLTHAAIAYGLNVKFGTEYTKNASIGRTKRLGLCGPVKVASEESRARTRDRDRLKKQARREAMKAAGIRILRTSSESSEAGERRRERDRLRMQLKRAEMKAADIRCVEIVPRNLTLLELEPNDCRYPYGDSEITFCGHAKMEGVSYCVPHFELCRGEGTYSERRAA